MTDQSTPPVRTLRDPATGRDVELVYAIPPQLLGEPAPADQGVSPAELLARLQVNRFYIVDGDLLRFP